MAGELVSVVIPIYNVERYLRRCLDSIIQQTYQELEIILIDDGSTDQSLAICREYAQADFRIKVIHKTNGGLSSARNAGIDQAAGEYIAFVDSDDYVHVDFIAELLCYIKKEKADIAQCGYITGQEEEYPQIDSISRVDCFTGREYLRHYFDRTLMGLGLCVNKLYRTSLFTNIRFPDGRIHEDVATVYKVIYSADRVVYFDHKLYYYYMTSQSIMRGDFNIQHLDWLIALEEKLAFLSLHGEMVLYNRSLQEYEAVLFKLYYQIKKNMPDQLEILREILSKVRTTFRIMIRVPEVSISAKALFVLGYVFPQTVGKIINYII